MSEHFGDSAFKFWNVSLTALLIAVTAVGAYYQYRQFELEAHAKSCMINLNINTPELITSPVSTLAALEINLHNTGIVGVRYGLSVEVADNMRLVEYRVRNQKLRIGRSQEQWDDRRLELERYIEPQDMETVVLALTANNKTASGELASIGTARIGVTTEGGRTMRFLCRAHPREHASLEGRRFSIICKGTSGGGWIAEKLGLGGGSRVTR